MPLALAAFGVAAEERRVAGLLELPGIDVKVRERGLPVLQAMLASMASIAGKDESLKEIADLPPGWGAWREKPGAPWQRYESKDE